MDEASLERGGTDHVSGAAADGLVRPKSEKPTPWGEGDPDFCPQNPNRKQIGCYGRGIQHQMEHDELSPAFRATTAREECLDQILILNEKL